MKITIEIENNTGVEFEERGERRAVRQGEYFISNQTGEIKRAIKDTPFHHIVLTPELDVELEDNSKRFPIDSWVKQAGLTNTTILYKVREVTRENVADGHFPVVIHCYDRSFFPMDCTPFPLPTWRCCDYERPKKDGRYFVKDMDGKFLGVATYSVNDGWYDLPGIAIYYGWLDEGEL